MIPAPMFKKLINKVSKDLKNLFTGWKKNTKKVINCFPLRSLSPLRQLLREAEMEFVSQPMGVFNEVIQGFRSAAMFIV